MKDDTVLMLDAGRSLEGIVVDKQIRKKVTNASKNGLGKGNSRLP